MEALNSSVVKIYMIRPKTGPVAKNATPRPSSWSYHVYLNNLLIINDTSPVVCPFEGRGVFLKFLQNFAFEINLHNCGHGWFVNY